VQTPRPVRLGISVTPYAAAYPKIVRQVEVAEAGGLDLVGIQDHPYQRRFLDTFLLIADLLARSERLRFFPDVANLPLRPPPMLAKAAASLDFMSAGRFELGIGAGAFWDAVAGMGGPRRSPREALAALEEGMLMIRAALDGDAVVRGPGPTYPIPGYSSGPPPAHRVEVWVGAYGPRALRLIGRLGDGWVPSVGRVTPEAAARGGEIIDAAALAAGRDPGAIRRIFNLSGSISADRTGGTEVGGRIHGSADFWARTLRRWTDELRADAFIFWPGDAETTEIERFAAEVAPGVRGE
jgi:alkanesulfonate monooxygenase SsuD/methylene tetrahydromethanopterin reductase-like flavin-dependent oxidoreductase (luciferase family)